MGRVREEKRRRGKIREEKESEERRCRCEKVEKSRSTVFFQWFVAPEGRKVGSSKRGVRSHLARWEMNYCTPLWREAHLEVKMYQSTSCSDMFGRLLEVEMSKKCTPFWREARFEVKSKNKFEGSGALLDVRMSFCVAGTRDSAPCQKWEKRESFGAVSTTTTTTLLYITLHSTTTTTTTTTSLHYTN